jgi:hypothetical protein
MNYGFKQKPVPSYVPNPVNSVANIGQKTSISLPIRSSAIRTPLRTRPARETNERPAHSHIRGYRAVVAARTSVFRLGGWEQSV